MTNNKRFFHYTLVALLAFSFTSCSDDDDDNMDEGSITLDLNGLDNLGSDYAYEGWIIVDGAAVTTGVFTVNDQGEMSKSSFSVSQDDLDKAATFVLTIEPSPDSDSGPSDVHILGGDINNGSADLTIGHGAALGNSFSASTGKFILATPTNGSDNDENSGVWFLDLASGSPSVGLDLPALPNGWIYEGWAVINGQPVSTGTFATTTVVDDADPFSGTMGGPPFPGEDFLVNAPSGLTFPVDLSDATMVISIEPSPDNSPNPFTLKPLLGKAPMNAQDHFTYPMDNIISNNNPTGQISF